MQSTVVDERAESVQEDVAPANLRHAIEHAAHYLPAQGPITVFVHHNTLHAFEHLGFDDGVKAGGRVFGCHAYLPEQRYREACRLRDASIRPLESIEESLRLLGIADDQRGDFITQTLLALRGWAGMVWQMESNADWAPHPAPPESLIEFLAVRLILDRISIAAVAREHLEFEGPLEEVRDLAARRISTQDIHGTDQRAFLVFQIAQVRGWKPQNLQALSSQQWKTLIDEIEAFSGLERRRTYHLAFERKYRNETLDAVLAHSQRKHVANDRSKHAEYQVVCCIDEREESFRRHLEEFDPECETLGVAGFFGVAMYYRGAAEAHFRPLCPVNIKPKHYIVEEPPWKAALRTFRKRGPNKDTPPTLYVLSAAAIGVVACTSIAARF